jgi:hypothetical protein
LRGCDVNHAVQSALYGIEPELFLEGGFKMNECKACELVEPSSDILNIACNSKNLAVIAPLFIIVGGIFVYFGIQTLQELLK